MLKSIAATNIMMNDGLKEPPNILGGFLQKNFLDKALCR